MKAGKIKKSIGVAAGIVLLLFAVYHIRAAMLQPVPAHPILNQSGLLVMAHRGGRGLWPENTLYAFRHAVALGVDVLDFDVHYLSDGNFAVIHDDQLERTTNGTGGVQDYILPELQRLDAGYQWTGDDTGSYPFRGQGITIPSLDEVFGEFPDTRMNIELKQSRPGAPGRLCDVIREFRMEPRVVIASFSAEVIREFRQICPGVATAAGTGEALPYVILNVLYLGRVYHPQAETLQLPGFRDGRQLLTARFVSTAHEQNMAVYAWTINETGQLQALLQAGVDGIITDYPDRLLELLGREKRVKSE